MKAWKLIPAVLLVGAAIAAAQEAYPMPPPGEDMPTRGRRLPEEWMDRDVRDLVEAVMMARLSRELGLNDEQTVLMMRHFSEFKEKTGELKKQHVKLVKALKESVQSGAPEAEIEAKLQALVEHDKAMAQAKLDIVEQTGAGLSVSQRAELYVFLGEFENEMRKLIQTARRRAATPGGERFPKFPQRVPQGMPEGQRGFAPGPGPDRPMPPGPPRLQGPQRRGLIGPGRRPPGFQQRPEGPPGAPAERKQGQ